MGIKKITGRLAFLGWIGVTFYETSYDNNLDIIFFSLFLEYRDRVLGGVEIHINTE